MAGEMIDRVARALRFVMYGVPDSRPLDDKSPWLIYAKTAIREMREPTEGMIRETGNCQGCEPENWHRMIDAALQ